MFHLGIDVSKDSFSAQLLLDHAEALPIAKDFKANKRGFNSLYVWLLKSGVVLTDLRVVMEATGVYWERLTKFLIDKDIRVAVVNPAQIKYFMQSYLRRGKTDNMDAGMIALYSLERNPKAFSFPSEDISKLKLLVSEREYIVKLITKERNRLHAHQYRQACSKELTKLIKKRIRDLRAQRADIELLIKQTIKASKELSAIYKLLVSIPGIAFVTAIVIIAETNALADFNNAKQLSAYVGIAPTPNQSGSFHGKSPISKIGNARLRKALYIAALSAPKASKHFSNFKARLEAKNKPKKVVFIAIARKLLLTAFAVVTSKTAFDPDYYKNYSSSDSYVH